MPLSERCRPVYSYGGEDDLILKHFGDFKGRFLDIGAWDGKQISNTYAFAQAGWYGVEVEGSFDCIAPWLKNMGSFPKISLINAAMGVTNGVVDWYYVLGCESTASERIKLRTDARQTAIAYKTGLITIADIQKAFPGDFDYISIDIEDWSIPVMQSIPYDKLNTKAVCIEYLHKEMFGVEEDKAITEWMSKTCGFKHLATTSENVIMVR